jgi:hypothetical protein
MYVPSIHIDGRSLGLSVEYNKIYVTLSKTSLRPSFLVTFSVDANGSGDRRDWACKI